MDCNWISLFVISLQFGSSLYKFYSEFYSYIKPCHSSGSWSPASHRGGLGSSPGQVMWDLWWTKWGWAGFLWVLRFPLQMLIPPTTPHPSSSIIRGWYNRPVSGRRTKWTQSHPTPKKQKKKNEKLYSYIKRGEVSPEFGIMKYETVACSF
jgi:hypothetical protein